MQYNIQKQAYSQQFPNASNSIIRLGRENIGRLIVDRSKREIRLVDISLLPKYRSLGLGTQIISDILCESQKKDLPLRLTVNRYNPLAFRLYQKLGFQITDEDEMYISMEWIKNKE
jgi:ribosomal protein S18 acetylase RimI-like enzyme